MFGKKDPAVENLRQFCQRLDREKLIYTKDEEKKKVTLSYNGDNFKSLKFVFLFDDDGESVAIRVWSIEEFTAAQLSDACEFCNRMNADYRWLTFYIDSDNELTARADSIANLKTMGPRGYEILQRFVRIVDKVCEKLYS